jgi:hypothetical protein
VKKYTYNQKQKSMYAFMTGAGRAFIVIQSRILSTLQYTYSLEHFPKKDGSVGSILKSSLVPLYTSHGRRPGTLGELRTRLGAGKLGPNGSIPNPIPVYYPRECCRTDDDLPLFTCRCCRVAGLPGCRVASADADTWMNLLGNCYCRYTRLNGTLK